MARNAQGRRMRVCLLSPHPLVLEEFERLLSNTQFEVITKQVDSLLAPDLRKLPIPRASVYILDAQAPLQSTSALIGNILERSEGARLIVVGQKFKETESHALLRQGVKGLLNYTEARDQLPRAVPLVCAGGYWVPRAVLSRFVDSILGGNDNRRFRGNPGAELSRREQEVLTGLLENLANKEVASRLNISERTVKFHVSNLLAKFGVRRRADLILLCYQQRGVVH